MKREDDVLAKIRSVERKFKDGRPVGFQATGRGNGWALRSNIYARKVKYEQGYEVEYEDDSKADVLVFPPSGPPYTNLNEPRPDGTDPLDFTGGVVVTKKGKGRRFGVGLPIIYDGSQTEPEPNYVTVVGFANCTR